MKFQNALYAASILFLNPSVTLAQDASGLDQKVNDLFERSTGWFVQSIFAPLPFEVGGVSFPWIVLWLVVGATIFTLYFGFIQFRAFGHAISLVKGDYSDPKDAGEVSHFQALATALSGTVGLGNIAGVAVAISIGGPGATFWMILAGLLGMASKFTECTLGVKYRNEYADGSVSGGPMYYISKGFEERGVFGGKFLAILFAVFCILGAFGGGNMFQANQAHLQIETITGAYPGWITGLIFAALVFIVIVGGIKSIAQVTEKIVPFMGILYVLAALVILVLNYDRIGAAFELIFAGAFTGLGVAGGMIGALIQGFRRAAFSNEAGVGSAAIAHSAVRTKEPVTEGVVALLEPFIDTVVICTMTALVITISGQLIQDPTTGHFVLYTLADVKAAAANMSEISAEQLARIQGVENSVEEMGEIIATLHENAKERLDVILGLVGEIKRNGSAEGVALTSAAFATAFSWFPYVLAIAVVLFAFSTMISWSYYGLKAWTYLFGEGSTKELTFKLIFCMFVVIGAAADLGPVIDFSDAAIFAMAVVNITALYVLMPIVKREVASYFTRLKTGEIVKYTS